MIIHNNDREFARIILPGKRGGCSSNRYGFISRGHDRSNSRPFSWRRSFYLVVIKFAEAPEPSPGENEVNPNGERYRRDENGRRRHTPFCIEQRLLC